MANGHGGYRKPANPAAVSGPGAHSRRTDGQPTMNLPDAQYGEAATFAAAQQAGNMATDQSTAPAPGGGAPIQFTGMGAPTTMPDVPVTAGAEYGAGPGMEAITQGLSPKKMDAQHLQKYLPALIDIADREDTPPGTKKWVRSIIANM